MINLISYKPENKLMIVLLKINYDKLDSISKDRTTDKSVWIKNFIDPDIGDIKIYKSKKRLELRLKPKEFINNKSFIDFNYLNEKVDSKNLRNIFSNAEELEGYCEKEIKKYKDFFENLKK